MKAWFYPGDNFGHEFVYPKVKAVELAKVNNEPVPSMPNEMAEQTRQPAPTRTAPPVIAMKKTPLKAEKPNQEVEIAEVFTPPPGSCKALDHENRIGTHAQFVRVIRERSNDRARTQFAQIR